MEQMDENDPLESLKTEEASDGDEDQGKSSTASGQNGEERQERDEDGDKQSNSDHNNGHKSGKDGNAGKSKNKLKDAKGEAETLQQKKKRRSIVKIMGMFVDALLERLSRKSTNNNSNSVNVNVNVGSKEIDGPSTPKSSTLLQNKIEELREEKTRLEKQLDELEIDLRAKSRDYDKIMDEYSLLKNKSAADQTKIKELKEENGSHSTLIKELEDQLEQTKKQYGDLKKQHSCILKALEQLQMKVFDEETKTNGLSEEKCNMRGKLSHYEDMNQKLKDENATLQNKSVTLQEELDELKKQNEKHLTLLNKLGFAVEQIGIFTTNNYNPRDEKYDITIKESDLAIEPCHDKSTSTIIDNCSSALALKPRHQGPLKRRAKAYEMRRELANALEDIIAACILENFKNKNTLLLAKQLLTELGQQHVEKALRDKKNIQPSNFFVKMYCSDESNDFTEKIDFNWNIDKYFKLRTLMNLGSYDGIISDYTERIKMYESSSERKVADLLVRAIFYMLTAKYEVASADLDAIIGSTLADKKLRTNALTMRAKLAMKMHPNSPAEWFQLFSEGKMIDFQNGDIYFHRGLAFMEIEQFSEALIDFEKACSLDDRNGIFEIYRYGASYRKALANKDVCALRKVMDDFHNLIKRKPIYVDSYIQMAEVLYDQQNFKKRDTTKFTAGFLASITLCYRIEVFNSVIMQALRLDDNSSFVCEALGMFQVQQGQLPGAIVLFDTATKMANTETELIRLYKQKNAVVAQLDVKKNMKLETTTGILDFLLADII